MEELKIKICGMRDPDNIQKVSSLQPDLMGFIFYPQSPRFVGKEFMLPTGLGQVKPVGVFVNESSAAVSSLCHKHGINMVQLHGHESVEECKTLRDLGISVIKAFSVDRDFDFEQVNEYRHDVDYFLFDAKGKSFGGNGQPFPWIKLDEYNFDVPFFLSGGLSVNNVSDALKLRHPQLKGLDFNSGLEISPGIKDTSLVKYILEMSRESKI